jgi:hypothetical protein
MINIVNEKSIERILEKEREALIFRQLESIDLVCAS